MRKFRLSEKYSSSLVISSFIMDMHNRDLRNIAEQERAFIAFDHFMV